LSGKGIGFANINPQFVHLTTLASFSGNDKGALMPKTLNICPPHAAHLSLEIDTSLK
jgi:hypothetical protein